MRESLFEIHVSEHAKKLVIMPVANIVESEYKRLSCSLLVSTMRRPVVGGLLHTETKLCTSYVRPLHNYSGLNTPRHRAAR
jgi:hypothetical protein